jgi:hypothetical protein
MLTKTDLIRLDHTPDLTEAGILSTCQWLARSSRYLGQKPYSYLRRKVGRVTVELALRRLLVERQVPFRNLELEPFSNPLQHQLSLGGHRLHLNSYLIGNRAQIRTVRQDPAVLLQASAITPLDQFVSEAQTSKDIHLFAFLLALTATSRSDQRKLETTDKPHFYLVALPKNWSQPVTWAPLNPIALKSESDQPVKVELGGLNTDRNFFRSQVQLQPHTRTIVTDEFYSLAYIHILEHPNARLGIHSPRFQQHSQMHIIQPSDWSNMWVYGMEIWLTGWLSLEEYHRRAVVLLEGQSSFQYSHTHHKNLCVPMTELHPLEKLFDQTRTWQAGKIKARK